MPQSLSLIVVHVIFSTKDRRSVLDAEILPELFAYLATVARNAGCECYRVGGVADYVHFAIRLSRTKSVAEIVEELKGASSLWLKTKGLPDFAWQRGYAAFSVGPKDLGALVDYIASQEEHHRERSFQDEFRALLKRYRVEFDERYVWD
ncbi:MAG TPA: IS200/IS605 family transposase [Acidobacteriaceae bacterium]|jgi:REP element-mobilizing transposase RayT